MLQYLFDQLLLHILIILLLFFHILFSLPNVKVSTGAFLKNSYGNIYISIKKKIYLIFYFYESFVLSEHFLHLK